METLALNLLPSILAQGAQSGAAIDPMQAASASNMIPSGGKVGGTNKFANALLTMAGQNPQQNNIGGIGGQTNPNNKIQNMMQILSGNY